MALSGCETVNGLGDGLPELVYGARGGFSQGGLELGEGHLDGVEVGRIGRQIQQAGARVLNALAHALDLVRGQIVHDNDIAGLEFGRQDLFDIGEEGGAMHRAVEQHRRTQAAQAQTSGKGGRLPMAMRDGGPAALAAPGASSQTSHFGRRPGFVDKDQAGGIEIGLAVEPRQPAQGDVRPLLLGGVRGFF